MLAAAWETQNMKSLVMIRNVQSGLIGQNGQSAHSHVMGGHRGEKENVFFQKKSLGLCVLVQRMRKESVT